MTIIAKTTLKKFHRKHPASARALNKWYNIARKASWSNFADLRQTFSAVDAAGNDRFVFNIKGNDYRLIAMIFFDKRTIYIRFVGTHAEYDEIEDCSTI